MPPENRYHLHSRVVALASRNQPSSVGWCIVSQHTAPADVVDLIHTATIPSNDRGHGERAAYGFCAWSKGRELTGESLTSLVGCRRRSSACGPRSRPVSDCRLEVDRLARVTAAIAGRGVRPQVADAVADALTGCRPGAGDCRPSVAHSSTSPRQSIRCGGPAKCKVSVSDASRFSTAVISRGFHYSPPALLLSSVVYRRHLTLGDQIRTIMAVRPTLLLGVPAMSKHVAIYLRVSSKAQDTRSQKPDLERWAAAQADPVKWYTDKFTGKTMDRPGWQKLQEDIRGGKVSKVICWRLDRLGRTAKGLTALFDDLQGRKVGLVSLKDGLDLSTPAGRLMAHVLASVDQYETEVRAERIRAGQEAARASGVTWGGSEKGWRRKATAEKAKLVKQMHAAGESVAAIARAVGLSRPTVYSILAAKPKSE